MRHWTPRDHSQGTAGFTLVELLVSLTLLGLISVALFGGFRFGTRAWEAGTAHADRLDEVQVVQGFLRGRLSQTMTPRHEGEEGKPEGLLTGDASVLRFTAPWLTSLNLGGLYKFELSLDRDGEKGGLLLRWEPLAGAWNSVVGEEADPSERLLLEGVQEITIAYYGTRRRGEDPAWHDSWDKTPLLPQLITIELDFGEGSDRLWPPLTVAMRVQR
jgi:general secretion pathway protein J